MTENKPKGHIIPHTHWDREWRYPIWQTRMMLVEFFDELLDILDNNPEYKTFLLDGQSVIVEDYLQIRPQNTEKIKKYISEGRLTVGPWYTLPDLYPVDGESLVRNLLKGIRTADSLGGHLNIGYTSFGWGQTAQFPQIVKVWLDMPQELNVWDFDITDSNGGKLEIQHVSRKEEMVPVNDFIARPWPFKMIRHCLYVKVENVPAFGYKLFKVAPVTPIDQIWANPTAMRTNKGNDIMKSYGPGSRSKKVVNALVSRNMNTPYIPMKGIGRMQMSIKKHSN